MCALDKGVNNGIHTYVYDAEGRFRLDYSGYSEFLESFFLVSDSSQWIVDSLSSPYFLLFKKVHIMREIDNNIINITSFSVSQISRGHTVVQFQCFPDKQGTYCGPVSVLPR